MPPTASLISVEDADRLTATFDWMVTEDGNGPIDGNRPEHVTAEDVYNEVVSAERGYTMDADGSLSRASADRRQRSPDQE